jgi:hypothetical protein
MSCSGTCELEQIACYTRGDSYLEMLMCLWYGLLFDEASTALDLNGYMKTNTNLRISRSVSSNLSRAAVETNRHG